SVDLKDADSLDFNENGDTQQEFAVIRVEDSGTGMDPDTRERIFEPFFTTKPEGEGTGLGMAVAFGIVKQHEGHIEVQSEPRQGTRFDVYLPVADTRMPPVRKEHERPVTPSSSGTETILLVEDNLQVRDLARLILTGAGYRVIEARDGVEAIRIFQQERDAIALVIMDVVMPRMGGKEVMTRLRQTDPAISILFTSGYSSGGIHTNFILEEGLDFIQKPYDSSTLRARVRYVLDRRVTTSVNRPIYNHRP
ncbi:MAG TPA: response regulator, partial [Pseudomonadales bacterium]|nr:response regulator [Pseudomonadales bacterium]